MSIMASGLAALHLSGQKGMNFWPLIGIVSVFVAAFIISKFVRGDPYYDRNASRDRRESGPAPYPAGDDGGDSGHSWF